MSNARDAAARRAREQLIEETVAFCERIGVSIERDGINPVDVAVGRRSEVLLAERRAALAEVEAMLDAEHERALQQSGGHVSDDVVMTSRLLTKVQHMLVELGDETKGGG
jgi:hypothetical protein